MIIHSQKYQVHFSNLPEVESRIRNCVNTRDQSTYGNVKIVMKSRNSLCDFLKFRCLFTQYQGFAFLGW